MQAIKITNSSDNEPHIKSRNLLTAKENEKLHSLWLKSAKKVVSKYNGSFEWNYKKRREQIRSLYNILKSYKTGCLNSLIQPVFLLYVEIFVSYAK